MEKRINEIFGVNGHVADFSEKEFSGPLINVFEKITNLNLYPCSIVFAANSIFALGHKNNKKKLVIASCNPDVIEKIDGQKEITSINGSNVSVIIAPISSINAKHLRNILHFLNPVTLGLNKSAGCGDRLGMSTPGHIRSLRKTSLLPIFAQQSVRENKRTGRTPQEVLDDAMWGVFQEGWQEGFGADADHLKTKADIDMFMKAGYTFFTIDPGDHVDDTANIATETIIREKVQSLPWGFLESTTKDMLQNLVRSKMDLGSLTYQITEEEAMRAAAKYGHVVAYCLDMFRYLSNMAKDRSFELEISVDETDTVTTLAEHIYIATELKRLGIECVSLAPRYLGEFEKGVDYIGDLKKFEKYYSQHAAVSRTFGPYKLSLHSGSDKFSIYPIINKFSGELCHLKTAGTSYLEALRTIATVNPKLFREIFRLAIKRYPQDKVSYHVSAQLSKLPDIQAMADSELSKLLDNFHSRQILHITYGSVLNHQIIRIPFFESLRNNEELYTNFIETHFDKHFVLF
ncbi:MAG: tagaturonate epimerase family protein [Desulfobacterales bacterium]|nr:tagaturonate epimerase family protein [Desulfobacterales bacterium]